MLPIQNPGTSSSLAAAFGLKGRVKVSVDEVLVPVAVVESFMPGSPYATATPIGFTGAVAAIALEIGGVGIEPGPNLILVVNKITVCNRTGSDAQFTLRLLSPAQITTVTTVSSEQTQNYNSPTSAGGVFPLAEPLGRNISHTVEVGTTVQRLEVLDNTTAEIDFPGGFALYGDDSNGPLALVIWNSLINEAMAANFFATIYRSKG